MKGQESTTTLTRLRRSVFTIAHAVVFFCMAAGFYLRWAGLRRSSMMMDTLWIYDMVNTGVSASSMMRDWLSVGGAPSTIPFSIAFATGFVRALRLPTTFGNLAIPFALWGTATILVAYLFGRAVGGRRFGLTLCAFAAFNPIMIQISREVYFYVSSIFGIMLVYWSTWMLLSSLQGRRAPLWRFHAINAFGVFVMVYSSPSTWTIAAVFGALQAGALAWSVFRSWKCLGHFFLLAIAYLAIAAPLFVVDWGIENMLNFTRGPVKAYWTEVFRFSPREDVVLQLLRVGGQCLWGTTVLRTIFTLTVLVVGALKVASLMRHDRRWMALGLMFCLVVVANVLALRQSVWSVSVRYVAGALPFLFCVAVTGLLAIVDRLSLWIADAQGKRGRWAYAFLVLPLALWTLPVYHIMKTVSQGFPYQVVSDFADTVLPKGAPVFTDRFFTAHNEFRIHGATNVVYMSFGPNQIRDQYLACSFRERAESAMRDNPVSGFFEEKHLWRDRTLGPWEWPHKFYARSRSFEDQHVRKLTELGVALRAGGALRFYYNLPGDVVDRARKDGAEAAVLFGDGWSGLATQAFYWRRMGSKATLDVFNLASTPRTMQIHIKAVAPGIDKHLAFVPGAPLRIPADRLVQLQAPPREFPPGKTSVLLRDPTDSADTNVLLVQSLEIVPMDRRE